MTDKTCININCPIRNNCYRYRIPPTIVEEYEYFKPEAQDYCSKFTEIPADAGVMSVKESKEHAGRLWRREETC